MEEMEDIMNLRSRTALRPQARVRPISKNLHVTSSKLKPKIRIVHIIAPEIIKTDPENFRELVQKLTGQPTKSIPMQKKTINKYKEKNNSLPATANAEAVNGLMYGMNEGEEDCGLFRDFGEINGILQGFSDLS